MTSAATSKAALAAKVIQVKQLRQSNQFHPESKKGQKRFTNLKVQQ
jgi:hypothetical protein